MSGFRGSYFVAGTFALEGPLATELTVELVRHASGIANLKADSTCMFSWCNAGFVPHTGGSTEIKRSVWEGLTFASEGSGRKYENKIHQAFFRLRNFDGITAYAFVAPFHEVAKEFKDKAIKMVAAARTPIKMFELELRPDQKLTCDPLWNPASNSLTVATNSGRSVTVSKEFEMHIDGENPNPVMLAQCVREVFNRLLPYIVTVDRRPLAAKSLVA